MRNFAAFILTHGRPDNVLTDKTLRGCGYTGPIYYIVDDEDKSYSHYKRNFGAHRVICFNKKEYADKIDEGNNFDNRRVIVHARNASFDIAEELGVTHFIQLDDDYYYFGFRDEHGAKKIKRLGEVFDALCDFFDSTNIKSIAFSQGGDHIGGFAGVKMKRKAMNSFLCSPSRRFTFVGSVNEDVNTYTLRGSVGDLFFTFTGLQLDQKDTQSQAGGMTGTYLENGTYVKSFSSVLFHPSSVRVSMMTTDFKRLHHSIEWRNTVPMIVPASEIM